MNCKTPERRCRVPPNVDELLRAPDVHIRVGSFQSTGRMGSPAVCSRKTSRRAATEIRVP
jgi:hypothetical protein